MVLVAAQLYLLLIMNIFLYNNFNSNYLILIKYYCTKDKIEDLSGNLQGCAFCWFNHSD